MLAFTTFLVHALVMAVIPPPQAVAPAVITRLAGVWTGAGVVNNAQVSARAEFGPVLSNRFVRLTYVFSVDGAGGVFEGHAYYACPAASTDCQGHWFDSQGATHVLTAVQTADALTSEWGDGTTPRGKTEYKITTPDTLVVTDWVRTSAGEWRQFGRVQYRKR